jgi:hypothetical protein
MAVIPRQWIAPFELAFSLLKDWGKPRSNEPLNPFAASAAPGPELPGAVNLPTEVDFTTHADERLAQEDRVHSDEEEEEIRQRVQQMAEQHKLFDQQKLLQNIKRVGIITHEIPKGDSRHNTDGNRILTIMSPKQKKQIGHPLDGKLIPTVKTTFPIYHNPRHPKSIWDIAQNKGLTHIIDMTGTHPLQQNKLHKVMGGGKRLKGEPMDIAWRLLKEDISWDDEWGHVYDKKDPHTHKCKHCEFPIYHHLQQGAGDGSHPPQEVWSNEDDEGGNCSSPSGFCEPGESLGKTYQSGEPIEATPESHPNRVWLNGRWVDVNDWTYEHEAEMEANKSPEGPPIVNWNDTWDYNKDIQTGEPMEIAMRLLKNISFGDPIDEDEDELNVMIPEKHPGDEGELETATEGSRTYFPTTLIHPDATTGIRRRVHHPYRLSDEEAGTFRDTPFNEETGFTRSEPMDIAFRLLKDRKSPEAFANKKKYDTKYHNNPKRREYRAELARERRKRKVMGDGGKDMSHAKNGKIVSEDASRNRARHFKGRGTLK